MFTRFGFVAFSSVVLMSVAQAGNLSGCTYKGIPLYGKVKIVRVFRTSRLKWLKAFPT